MERAFSLDFNSINKLQPNHKSQSISSSDNNLSSPTSPSNFMILKKSKRSHTPNSRDPRFRPKSNYLKQNSLPTTNHLSINGTSNGRRRSDSSSSTENERNNIQEFSPQNTTTSNASISPVDRSKAKKGWQKLSDSRSAKPYTNEFPTVTIKREADPQLNRDFNHRRKKKPQYSDRPDNTWENRYRLDNDLKFIKSEWTSNDLGEYNYLKEFDGLSGYRAAGDKIEKVQGGLSPTPAREIKQEFKPNFNSNLPNSKTTFLDRSKGFSSYKRNAFTSKQLKQTSSERLIEAQDPVYYTKVDKNSSASSSSSKTLPKTTTSHLQNSLQAALIKLLKQSTRTLIDKVHKPFIENCLVHTDILESRPKWTAPEIERTEWVQVAKKAQKDSKDVKNPNKEGQTINQTKLNEKDNTKTNLNNQAQNNPDKRNQKDKIETNDSNKSNAKQNRFNKNPNNKKRRKNNVEVETNWSDVMKESGKLINYIRTIKANPFRLHNELWYNDKGEANDGRLCKCSDADKKIGIRHSIYPGEEKPPKLCPEINHLDKFY